MRRLAWFALAAAAVATVQGGGLAQKNDFPLNYPTPQQQGGSMNRPPKLSNGAEEMPASVQERMALARSNDRQKALVSDTDKLVELVLALKKDVDKTDKNMLSLEVVKRAEQIEKLARSVKDRERGAK